MTIGISEDYGTNSPPLRHGFMITRHTCGRLRLGTKIRIRPEMFFV